MVVVYWLLGVALYLLIGRGLWTVSNRGGTWSDDYDNGEFMRALIGLFWPAIIAVLTIVGLVTLLWNTPEGVIYLCRVVNGYRKRRWGTGSAMVCEPKETE